jgi:hypothetical protein
MNFSNWALKQLDDVLNMKESLLTPTKDSEMPQELDGGTDSKEDVAMAEPNPEEEEKALSV